MKQTRLMMGMPITVEIIDRAEDAAGGAGREEPAFGPAICAAIDRVFDYFTYVDETFSPFKETSEISRVNLGVAGEDDYSDDMRLVLRLCKETSAATQGYFDIGPVGQWDVSGVVKGWAINNAAHLVHGLGHRDYYVEAGGDIHAGGRNRSGERWRVGIRDPFDMSRIIKVIGLSDQGIATSGTYIRGQHVRNPYAPDVPLEEVLSLTVVADDAYEADRFATAAFAMQRDGIYFIESTPGLEGYAVDRHGIATMTSGFQRMVIEETP